MDRGTSIRRGGWVIAPAIIVLAAIFGMSGIADAAVGRAGGTTQLPVAPPNTSTTAATVVADNGFRPQTDGFSFANYTCNANTSDGTCAPPETSLTPAEMRKLFGDGVCSGAPSDTCTLTSDAQAVMDKENAGLPKGGHCFGFSVTSLLLWKRQVTPDQFGAASTPRIPLKNNEAIQREIAYTFVTQGFRRVQSAKLVGTPNQILNSLVKALTPTATETYTIGFFNGKKGAAGEGHAVTPYAVEDLGGGSYAVLIYDNNYPYDQNHPDDSTRAMVFDTRSNTWAYQLEPSLIWRGSAADPEISLIPTSATIGPS